MMPRELLETRLGLYRLLSALYRYPLRQEILEALAGFDWQGETPLALSLRQIQQSLKTADAASLEGRLNIEMTRLMEGPGVTPAVPYASYYLHGKQLMGPSTQAASRSYLDWRVFPEESSIPADHIALELGFLAFLAERALDKTQEVEALRASRLFLQKLLRPWLSQFCAELECNSRESFFAALASLTHQIVETDQVWLEESLVHSELVAPAILVNN